jgi:hypothetical protein
MKATLVFLSFLLFFVCTHSLFCAAAEEPDAVRDTDGKKVRAGEKYYILPVMRGSGGGLTVSSFGKELCPLSIVQEQQEVKRGLPFTFTPANPKKGGVRVTTDPNFKFSAITISIESNIWKHDHDEATRKYIIQVVELMETLSDWLRLKI